MAFVIKRAWKTGLFLLFTCWFTGVSVAEVSASVKDSLSYENYCKMLERETRIPVSEIPNDEGMKYLQERIKAMKKEYGNDKRAYAAMVEQLRVHIRQESYDHARRLMITAKLTNTRIDDLEAVCYYFNGEKLKLMKELGPKNFIYNYLVAEGIIVRNRNSVSLCGNCLRVTVGTRNENERLVEALEKYKV